MSYGIFKDHREADAVRHFFRAKEAAQSLLTVGRYYDPRENRTHFAEVWIDERVKDDINPDIQCVLQKQADEAAQADDPSVNYWKQVRAFVQQRDTLQDQCGDNHEFAQELTRRFDKLIVENYYRYWGIERPNAL